LKENAVPKKKDIDTDFQIDNPNYVFLDAPDTHDLINGSLYTKEIATLEKFFEHWAFQPKFDLKNMRPTSLFLFSDAFELATCVLLAYRIEAEAKLKKFGAPDHWIKDDDQGAELAETIDEIISCPEYAPYVDLLCYRFDCSRQELPAFIADHQHEDNGHLFNDHKGDSLDACEYAAYEKDCESTGDNPMEKNAWFVCAQERESKIRLV